MKDVLEACAGASRGECLLTCSEDLGAQHDVAGRLGAVDVAERCGDQIATPLTCPERVGHLQQVGGRGVKIAVGAPGT
jgi:hypothetical protein